MHYVDCAENVDNVVMATSFQVICQANECARGIHTEKWWVSTFLFRVEKVLKERSHRIRYK